MSIFNKSDNKIAIAYYRHSAEDKQENSVPIQRELFQKFVNQYGISLIHEEADEGKSGLSANRPGFERLFNDWILNLNAPHFDYVLVYDVSRWGRFQDQDEAAYYEFRCRQRGKKVIYISRGFPKEEQQLISHLQTSIERYMAAEYSRQLSEKVFYGCKKVSEQGFSAGGSPCYGMGRLLLDESHIPIKMLKAGEWKAISNQRVAFTPLNDESTKTVQEIFNFLVKHWLTPKEIAEELNNRGIPSARGGAWDSSKVFRILTNETYTGKLIYNKTWGRLKQKMRQNPRNDWVIKTDAFSAIVDDSSFREAQEHLYWLMLSRWKRGIYAINRTRKDVQKEIISLFIKQGLNEQEAGKVAERIPLTFGISFYRDGVQYWCFLIEENIRNYEFVLGVGIILDKRQPIDKFFLIPTKDFTSNNFIIFSGAEGCYSEYTVKEGQIEEKILSLHQELIIKNQ